VFAEKAQRESRRTFEEERASKSPQTATAPPDAISSPASLASKSQSSREPLATSETWRAPPLTAASGKRYPMAFSEKTDRLTSKVVALWTSTAPP